METRLLMPYHLTKWCNCYGVTSENAAVVIDPGKYSDAAFELLRDNKDKQRAILITHGHPDHILGAEQLRRETDTPIYCDKRNCIEYPDGIYISPSMYFNTPETVLKADVIFSSDCEISVGDMKIDVIHTPGHHIGCVCYLIGDCLFSGDTLFYETVGVTKFPTGSKEDMTYSIKRLKTLNKNIKVYPGHGKFTDMAHEREYNPFMR